MELIANADDPILDQLHLACSDIKTLLQNSTNIEKTLEKMDQNFDNIQESLTITSRTIAPLQSLSIGARALETRINRAISPALALLESFKLSESLQKKLLNIGSKLLDEKSSNKRLKKLIKYVDCVDELNSALTAISQDCEPAIQKLQEVVEFLSRTKATDQYRTHRLRETLVTLRALYETEVETMRFDGLLDEALLNLQDEFESLLQQLRHKNIGDRVDEMVPENLGTELELQVLRRISQTLAINNCLDICIDIFVKVRYRRAAKALMKLSPDYLKTYTPEDINAMEWEALETAIVLWIQHFQLALKLVFVSEKNFSHQVLGNIMEGLVWPECFVKIADKIMAVFFRFAEGVARSNKEPQKLFKLLDMFDSLERLKPEFTDIFEGEAGADIRSRFREVNKLLIHSSTRVFWEFGLQIESNQDGVPPPLDGAVPKLVRYAINYLKNLAVDSYSTSMSQVLRTDQLWKAGVLSTPDTDENLLRDAISNVMEAIERNVENKKLIYKDKVVSHIFRMNTYWYIYMRTRNTELGTLLGEQYMKVRYRQVAEESAYLYQKQAWGSLVRLLETEEIKRVNKDCIGGFMRGKLETFMVGFDEMCKRHRTSYSIISDADLREQMRDATVGLLLPAYTEFINNYSSFLDSKAYMSPELLEDLLGQIFEGVDQVADGKSSFRRKNSNDRKEQRRSMDQTHGSRDFS